MNMQLTLEQADVISAALAFQIDQAYARARGCRSIGLLKREAVYIGIASEAEAVYAEVVDFIAEVYGDGDPA